MKTKMMSDEQLIAQMRGGHLPKQQVIHLLYERYYSKVLSKCLYMLKDRELALDEAQNIFVKVIQKLSYFNAHSKFSTWLYAISHNHCIDAIRKLNRSPLVMEVEEDALYGKREEGSTVAEREERYEKLEYILAQMPPGDKELLQLKYLNGHKIKDISVYLNKSEGAIKMALSRAKSRAKSFWGAEFCGLPM